MEIFLIADYMVYCQSVIKKISIMVKVIWFTALSFYFPYILQANGGPVDIANVLRTGDVCPLHVNYIKLEREDLHLRIDGDYVEVKVRYEFQANTISLDTIPYGFPVDIAEDPFSGEFTWEADYLPFFEIRWNGQKLPVQIHDDFSVQIEPNDVTRSKRRWFFTHLFFDKNNPAILEISYRVKAQNGDWGISKYFFHQYSDRKFQYDFSPAAYWGEGRIKQFRLSVDDSSVQAVGGAFYIDSHTINRDSGGLFVYQNQDFHIADLPDLRLRYDISNQLYTAFIRKFQVPSILSESLCRSSVSSDSQHANLFDNDFSTAWIAKGKKQRWLEVTISEKYKLGAIVLLGGNAQSRETWEDNDRLKTVLLDLTMENGELPGKFISRSDTLKFEDEVWTPLNQNNFAALALRIDLFDMSVWDRVHYIRLTIVETYPGKKYHDACISEIILLSEDMAVPGQD